MNADSIANATVNVGFRLSQTAQRNPQGIGVVVPKGRDRAGQRLYQSITFRELEDDSNRIASGLYSMGVRPGMRLVLMVRPGIDFVSLVFAMFKAGVVTVLVDPGMGRSSLIRCLEEVRPDGFVAIPLVQAIRTVLGRRFSNARFNVTVGRRWFWSGANLAQLRSRPVCDPPRTTTRDNDPAAIIFTTGSTGPPKGVLYQHANFDQQVIDIRDRYQLEPGGVDLSGFPLFALFNTAWGVTTVFPEMDFTRPADVDPRNIVNPILDLKVTQSFGSPALWNVVGRYCERENVRLPSLKRVFSAGAPVPPHVLQRISSVIAPDGEVFTPYGATEALPIASISASEVLGETAGRSACGAGTCVGTRYAGVDWKVIAITDDPIPNLSNAQSLPVGQIGELLVRGRVVTREYVTRTDANLFHKVADGSTFWHRMGDVGYLDEQDRFWFCGRKGHRVTSEKGPMFTVPCEAILNQHDRIYRTALVGVGEAGKQRPVLIAEPWPEKRPSDLADEQKLIRELQVLASKSPLTSHVRDFLLHPSMPVDIRHNSKIFREKLAIWAARQLKSGATS